MEKEKTREELREKIGAKKIRKKYKVVKRKIVKGDYKMTEEQEKSIAKVVKRNLERLRAKKKRELSRLHPGSRAYKQKQREIDNLE